ncbi:MAG: tetratricopeptide repeat protein, partial [Planctomycetota bacterium]
MLSRAAALAAALLAAGCMPAYAPAGSRDPKFLQERRAAFRKAAERGRALEAAASLVAEAAETRRPETWLLAAEALECPDLAWKAWTNARRLSPTAADSLRTRAILETRDGRGRSALESAREALRAEPERVDIAILAAELARRCGRLPEALEGFKAILERERGNPAALAGEARILEMRGETEEAAAILARAVEARPDAPLPRRRLRRLAPGLRDRSPLERAEAALAHTAEARKGDAFLAADRSLLLRALGKRDAALAIYRAAKEPGSLESDHLLDWRLAAVEAGAPVEALRIDETLFGFARGPDDAAATKRARIGKAARDAEAGKAGAWKRLGEAFRDLGWLPEAETAFKRAAAASPPDAGGREALADVRAIRKLIERLRAFAEEGYRDFAVRGRTRDLADLEAFLRREGVLPAGKYLRPARFWPVGWVLHDEALADDPLSRRFARWNLYVNAGRRAGGTLEIGAFPVAASRNRTLPDGRVVPFVASGGRLVETYDEWRGLAAAGGAILGPAVLRPENVHDPALLDADAAAALAP